ncbi:MAG: hypothetical protein QOC72_213 [Methylobacteriaceae bacterium]|jgi:hypothetical protein|nr:hypothetical protein [Methylobacteriaceae bacterium]
MNDLEDLNAKAARLWLEFMQAQAKAAADAAKKLPEVTRSLAEAGVPLAAEMNRWFGGALPPSAPEEAPLTEARHREDVQSSSPILAAPAQTSRSPRPPRRVSHRRLKMPKSMSRRRARRV